LDKCIPEYIKRWIYTLKEIKQRAEKHKNKENIRGYFLSTRQRAASRASSSSHFYALGTFKIA